MEFHGNSRILVNVYGKKIMTILAIGDHEISLQAACPETSIALTNIIERKIKFYPFKSK